MCVCLCTFQLKVQLIYVVPLLIPSQNGCCQAEKLPNGPLRGLNGKLIHVCGLFGALASNVKSWLVGESTSALSDAESLAQRVENRSVAVSPKQEVTMKSVHPACFFRVSFHTLTLLF